MTTTAWAALIGTTVAIVAMIAINHFEMPAPRETADPPKLPEQRAPLLDALDVEGVRQIGEHQTITSLRIPDAQLRYNRHFDRYCLIYEHQLYRSVHVICDAGLNVSGAESANFSR